jgi:bacterioferritin (cytochrome b1)
VGPEQRFALRRRRRGFGRAVVFLVVVAAFALAGCGRSGRGAETDPVKASDVEQLNVTLAQELTAIEAYDAALPHLRGQALAIGRQFHAQNLAHADALTKAIRGLGGLTDAEAAQIEAPAPTNQVAALTLAYEHENAALAEAQDASPHLETAAPRTLMAALAASHAQHLAILRQALGTPLVAAVPEPFEPGDLPPPGQPR